MALNTWIDTNIDDKKNNRVARYEKYSQNATDRSDLAYQASQRLVENIPFGQPILRGHHSENKHRNAISKSWNQLGKSVSEDKKSNYFSGRADSAKKNTDISSVDSEAIEKLKMKLENLLLQRDHIKKQNSIARKHVKANDIEALLQMGVSNKDIPEVIKMNRIYPSYMSSNLSGNIKNVKDRISSLESIRQMDPLEYKCDSFNMATEEGQFKFKFDGKPSIDSRKVLKMYAFKWSSYQKKWVRKVTPNALYGAKKALEGLKEIDATSSIY